MSMKSMKVSLALVAAMMAMSIGPATAASESDVANSVSASQSGQSSYAEEAQCMLVVVRMRTINPEVGAVATAMLGRLPPCEVRKIIKALP